MAVTLVLDLSTSEEQELSARAALAGMPLTEYARHRLLSPHVASECVYSPLDRLPDNVAAAKPFNIMQFARIAPRSADEIETHIADIRANREEWDESDYRQAGFPQTDPL